MIWSLEVSITKHKLFQGKKKIQKHSRESSEKILIRQLFSFQNSLVDDRFPVIEGNQEKSGGLREIEASSDGWPTESFMDIFNVQEAQILVGSSPIKFLLSSQLMCQMVMQDSFDGMVKLTLCFLQHSFSLSESLLSLLCSGMLSLRSHLLCWAAILVLQRAKMLRKALVVNVIPPFTSCGKGCDISSPPQDLCFLQGLPLRPKGVENQRKGKWVQEAVRKGFWFFSDYLQHSAREASCVETVRKQ